MLGMIMFHPIIDPIIGIILIFPLWKICKKLGRKPALSLISIVPFFGLMALALMLALGRWPSFDGMALQNSGDR